VSRADAKQLSVVTMGSLKVDVLTHLSPGIDLSLPDAYDVAPVELRIGGTAGAFSRAAGRCFGSVGIIAAVGEDAFTNLLVRYVESVGATGRLQLCPGVPNGIVLSVRGGESAPLWRLMIASQDSAHLHLSAEHVAGCRDLITAANALVCDAYFLRSSLATHALATGMAIANRAGVPVVFDLVPHSLPASVLLVDLLSLLERAQIVVAEARTIVGLCEKRWPVPEPADERMASTAAVYAQRLHRATWLIRYGTGNLGSVLRVEEDGTQIGYSTTYEFVDDYWGYGDRLLASELHAELRLSC
jgi:sugar/nucleoside kinase (ribokinase family)